jgi:hypothetical protein
MENIDYKKYKWFFTSSGKLVIGGKSAEQNEEVIKKFAKNKRIILHTKAPGSPFSVIISNHERVNEKDIDEAAVFTASFSQEWKKKKKVAEVHVFESEQIKKDKKMKLGTFGIIGEVTSIKPSLVLDVGFQKDKIKAVPHGILKKPLIMVAPGNIEKEKFAEELENIVEEKTMMLVKKEEILQALPSGGFKILKLSK